MTVCHFPALIFEGMQRATFDHEVEQRKFFTSAILKNAIIITITIHIDVREQQAALNIQWLNRMPRN